MKISNTIKKKLLLTGLISVVGIALSFQLSFNKTISLYKKYQVVLEERNQSTNLPQQVNLLQQQLSEIAGTIGSSEDGIKNKRALVIDRVSNFCNNNTIRVRELPSPIVIHKSDFTIETNIVKTEGPFINLLKLVDNLEKENTFGKVISVNFFSEIERVTKSRELNCEIFIQNITKQHK